MRSRVRPRGAALPTATINAVNLTWKPLGREDVTAATELINTVAHADGTGEVTTAESQAEMFGAPGFDPALDTITAWDGATLVGAGSVFVRESLVDGRALTGVMGLIHPDHRGQGVGAQLLTRLEQRGIAKAGELHPGAPVRLRSPGGLADSAAQRLLEAFGYRADNYFITMEAELATWIDPGIDILSVAPEPEHAEQIRQAHNDAFRDHRNSSPIPSEHWEHLSNSVTLRTGQSRIVLEGGRVLAYAMAQEFQPGVSHIGLVGTRREARGRGLAKDVLIGSLRSAKQAGYRVSELEVDSTSPTGADRLYRSVGYEPVRVISRYIRDVG